MLYSLENLGKAWLELIKSYKDLFFLELKLARYSFIPFCLLALTFIVVFGAFCTATLLLLAYLIHDYTQNWLLTLVIIEAFSLVIVGFVFLMLRVYYKRLKFHHFRNQLDNFHKQDRAHEPSKAFETRN